MPVMILKYWRAIAVALLLTAAYSAGYTRADNAWEAKAGKDLAVAQTEFDTQLKTAVDKQQAELTRQRRIADAQVRKSQERAERFRALWARSADRPLPDCSLSDEWVLDIRSALAGGAAVAAAEATTGRITAGGLSGSTDTAERGITGSGPRGADPGRAVLRLQGQASGFGLGGDQ